jgi:hypothetical protein
MKALALRTRFRTTDREGDACLLVYDTVDLAASTISSDVRDVLVRRPNTPWIYVLCPFLNQEAAHGALFGGFAPDRAGHRISLLHFRQEDHTWKIKHSEKDGQTADIDPELVHGWLFDLFDSRGGLVKAPAGVHFTKLSGQHTDRFLRASNVLLTSAAIGAIAFFCLGLIGDVHVKRVFVDTAPLVGVAFAMARVAKAAGMRTSDPEVESFSSYGGLSNLPPLGSSDLFLLSASTSGSLAGELVRKDACEDLIITLFLLGIPPTERMIGKVACNLTITKDRFFGYEPVVNAKAEKCRFCQRGYLAAPLEGDQFLLEKRDVTRMRISSASQPKQARDVMEKLARKGLLSVELFTSTRKTNIRLDLKAALEQVADIRELALRLLRRFTPNPLDVIVLVDIDIALFKFLVAEAALSTHFQNIPVYTYDQLASIPAQQGARVLVFLGVIDDHAKVRSVNAQMRVKAPHGDVAYLSVLSIVDSAQSLRELEMFLCYGERGADTFTFKSAISLMLPNLDAAPTSWTQELELLQRMSSDLEQRLAPELQARLSELLGQGIRQGGLFIGGKNGPLKIAADFVYLSTNGDLNDISQADVFAVVSNLLATARCNNVGLATPPGKLPGAVVKNQSVYGQVLVNLAALCPRNLRDYNDAILRAAFLRASHLQELNYAVDEGCSAEVLAILVAEVDAWKSTHGNATPEILMALACGRLKLWPEHLERFVKHSRLVIADDWALQLLDVVVTDVNS